MIASKEKVSERSVTLMHSNRSGSAVSKNMKFATRQAQTREPLQQRVTLPLNWRHTMRNNLPAELWRLIGELYSKNLLTLCSAFSLEKSSFILGCASRLRIHSVPSCECHAGEKNDHLKITTLQYLPEAFWKVIIHINKAEKANAHRFISNSLTYISSQHLKKLIIDSTFDLTPHILRSILSLRHLVDLVLFGSLVDPTAENIWIVSLPFLERFVFNVDIGLSEGGNEWVRQFHSNDSTSSRHLKKLRMSHAVPRIELKNCTSLEYLSSRLSGSHTRISWTGCPQLKYLDLDPVFLARPAPISLWQPAANVLELRVPGFLLTDRTLSLFKHLRYLKVSSFVAKDVDAVPNTLECLHCSEFLCDKFPQLPTSMTCLLIQELETDFIEELQATQVADVEYVYIGSHLNCSSKTKDDCKAWIAKQQYQVHKNIRFWGKQNY